MIHCIAAAALSDSPDPVIALSFLCTFFSSKAWLTSNSDAVAADHLERGFLCLKWGMSLRLLWDSCDAGLIPIVDNFSWYLRTTCHWFPDKDGHVETIHAVFNSQSEFLILLIPFLSYFFLFELLPMNSNFSQYLSFYFMSSKGPIPTQCIFTSYNAVILHCKLNIFFK